MPTRTAISPFVAALALACVCACSAPPPVPRDAVLITVDTLRADRIGAYGYTKARTPNLDALAAESIRFERAHAHSSMTMPSMASLLTGRLPGEHGVLGNGRALPPNLPTLATVLRDAGFQTAAFIGSFAMRRSRGLARGFERYTDEYESREAIRYKPENRAGPLTDEAIAWLAERRPDERFFLWVHYQEPHGPYTPPSFEAPPPTLGPELPQNRFNSGIDGIPRYQWLGHGRLAEYEARYDGEIAEMDRHLGRLMEALHRFGVWDTAVVAFTADHGEAFGEDHLYCAHGEGLDDALLRVPLLLRVPGHPAEVRADAVRLIDVGATLLEALGVENTVLRGRSLFHDEGDRLIVAQVGSKGPRRWRSVRQGDLELREHVDDGVTLHSSVSGAGEGAASPQAAQLESILGRLAPWPQVDVRDDPLTPQEAEALRALGYLD